MIQWLFIVIAVEAIVEIVVSSRIFMPFNNWVAVKSSFLGSLLDCGYCFSVWVAIPFGVFCPGEITGILALDILIKIMVIHRISNLWHEFLARWFERHPWVFVLNKESVNKEEDEEIDLDE